ncbi:hypothetical protein [Vibrio sp. CAU 1672]|uniref:hypothetical protein n=1 Tax=Vibrio sp. CAU 1672 TaxID=3032594 RepID=UPI0023DCBA03|nr:hypothetical protein [Vibrio sp. CAU 1672]MDF2153462.1 hypothetical protein [Vibrio sp. CAU 1672]
MIGQEEMAMSSYLGWLLILLIGYPFALVAIQIGVFDVRVRTRVNRWFNWGMLLALLLMHLQTEVVYGQYFLELWQSKQQTSDIAN